MIKHSIILYLCRAKLQYPYLHQQIIYLINEILAYQLLKQVIVKNILIKPIDKAVYWR